MTFFLLALVFPLILGCEPALLTELDTDAGGGGADTGSGNGGDDGGGENVTGNPFAGQMEAAVEGASLYEASACATCHGEQGEGTQSFPGLEMTADQSDEEVFEVIEMGRLGTAMSGYGEAAGGPLSDEEIWKIVTFIRTLTE